MKKKKYKTIFLAHSHWDREWYLSHGRHNYRLIKFMDRLLGTLISDETFTSFHLDGQIILIEDYLAVRPQRRDDIIRLVRDGRLKIGPNFILQDEYLVSGEATVRNLLYGIRESRQFGEPTMCGYFPDAFGNISQIPQIMLGFGIDNAFFGRGIVPMGYANEVIGMAEEGFAELLWQGADGSEIIGVQFVNWYNNGNELPHETAAAAERIRGIEDACKRYSRTPVFLALNGCDHQPVQTDLPDILARAQPYVASELQIGSLEEYMREIRPYRDRFYRYRGEICGLNGNGFFSLVHTASSRVYLKQLNHRAQCLLEEEIEPLMSMDCALGGKYDFDLLRSLWKRLLENHPHDSICGCSCDEVCDKMETRFSDVIGAGNDLKQDIMRSIARRLLPSDGKKRVLVFNTGITCYSGFVEASVDFYSGKEIPARIGLQAGGQPVPCVELARENRKIFTLPEDSFRRVYEVTTVRLRFSAEVPALSAMPLEIVEAEKAPVFGEIVADSESKRMENGCVALQFSKDGSFLLTDKASGRRYEKVNLLYGQTDRGNEYEFIPEGEKFFAGSDADIEIVQHNGVAEARCRINVGGQEAVSVVTLECGSPVIKVKTTIRNARENWRLRTSAGCGCKHEYAVAYGQFDCVRRKIRPGEKWKNPCRDQRFDGYVYADGAAGLAVASRGLHEYEVSDEPDGDILSVTLLRAVGEMGDWFYFPTPGAQIQRTICAEYAFIPFTDSCRLSDLAEEYSRPKISVFIDRGEEGKGSGIAVSPFGAPERRGNIQFSALKRAEEDDGFILRVFNPSEQNAAFFMPKANVVALDESAENAQMAERDVNNAYVVPPKRILSLKLE